MCRLQPGCSFSDSMRTSLSACALCQAWSRSSTSTPQWYRAAQVFGYPRRMGDFGPGTVLAGRFEILRPLGTGGLAEVMGARDRVTGQDVAVKVLHSHLAREEEIAERFGREMSVTRGLDHPGIVRVFDLHEHEGRPFFTMELLQGETLAERLKRGAM